MATRQRLDDVTTHSLPPLPKRPPPAADDLDGEQLIATMRPWRRWLKQSIIAAAVLLCTTSIAADDEHHVTHIEPIESLLPTFTENTTIIVDVATTVRVDTTINLVANGTIDGESVQGSAYWTPLGSPYEVSPGTTLHFFEGSVAPPFYQGAGVIEIVILLAIIAMIIAFGINIAQSGRLRLPVEERTVRIASRLLPSAARDEYLEEWTIWLQDLKANGTCWHHRVVELMSILLVAAPRLAIILRFGAQRAADR